jgi:hypothetical protein
MQKWETAMIKMRETERSLRDYFLLVGIVSGALNVAWFVQAKSRSTVEAVFALVSIALCAWFIISGIFFKRLLRSAPGQLRLLLFACMAMALVTVTLCIIASTKNYYNLIRPIVVILICAYLLINVNRLAREASTNQLSN